MIVRRAALTSNALFQALMWRDTFNVFLSADQLAELIDEDPDEIRRVLTPSRAKDVFEMFLRAHGIIGRLYGYKMTWCLLGIGQIQDTFSSPNHLFHAMNAEPKASFFDGSSARLQVTSPDEGTDLLALLRSHSEFLRDVHNQTKCRRCGKNVPVGGWTYVRLESLVSPLLRPEGQVAEVGLRFRCECRAIHLGEPLPRKGGTGEVWSLGDKVVEVAGRTCPVRETGPGNKRRREHRVVGR
ncbi:unnamed protein product [Scytosiphon promiscuus]